jgi:putative membrane protein
MYGGFMWVFWIAVLVGLFFLVKWIVQQKPGDQKPEENALEVLKKRYARGEIDKEEFEQKKKDLLS